MNNQERQREYNIKKAAVVKIVAFILVIFMGAVVSLILPLRPGYSANEKRELTDFPEFTVAEFLNGQYFKQIDLWFSDTFPFRDSLILCNDGIQTLYGVRDTIFFGKFVAADDIPDVAIDVEDLNSEDDTGKENNNNENYDIPVEAEEVDNSVEKTDDSVTAKEGESFGSLYAVGNAAYDYYFFSQKNSDSYVGIVNRLADNLGEKSKVYCMIVPTSIDITLDDSTRNSLSSSDQQKAIMYMYSRMSGSVKKTYIYDIMRQHRNEYVYFRTDHHWTALGAYYAYTVFISQTGREPYSLSDYETVYFENFQGTFYSQTGLASLGNNPDYVVAYKPISTNRTDRINKNGAYENFYVVADVSGWLPQNKYSTFLGGDHPYTHISNPNLSDGSACLVIKESFGNALAPFLVDHFQDVYVVDYRYYNGTVSELVDKYDIENVLFINNVAATSTTDRLERLGAVSR